MTPLMFSVPFCRPLPQNLRERILDLSGQRFRQRGIRNYSMDELAAELGVSKKTVYQHFPNKKDIVLAFIEKWMRQDEEDIKKAVAEHEHPIDLMTAIFQLIQNNLSMINPIMFQDLQRFYPEAWDLMHSFRDRCVRQSVEGQIQKGIEMGLFRADQPTELVIELQLRIIDMLIDLYFDLQGRYSLQLIQYHQMLLLMYGMCNPKGAELLRQRLEAPESPVRKPDH